MSEGEQIIVNTSTDGSLAAIENSMTAEFQEISGICLSTLATIYRFLFYSVSVFSKNMIISQFLALGRVPR